MTGRIRGQGAILIEDRQAQPPQGKGGPQDVCCTACTAVAAARLVVITFGLSVSRLHCTACTAVSKVTVAVACIHSITQVVRRLCRRSALLGGSAEPRCRGNAEP